MKTFPDLVACEHCDSVYKRAPGRFGDVAHCAVCDAVLYRGGRVDVDHWLAWSLAAAVAFTIANVCPFVQISLQEFHNAATLWQAAQALAAGPTGPIAVPLALSIIIVPALQIGLLCWALAYARTGRRAPGFVLVMRLLVALRPWSMVEVGVLGILVGAIKLGSYMKVIPGPGLWGMAASMVLLTLIASRETRVLWDVTAPDAAPAPLARETA